MYGWSWSSNNKGCLFCSNWRYVCVHNIIQQYRKLNVTQLHEYMQTIIDKSSSLVWYVPKYATVYQTGWLCSHKKISNLNRTIYHANVNPNKCSYHAQNCTPEHSGARYADALYQASVQTHPHAASRLLLIRVYHSLTALFSSASSFFHHTHAQFKRLRIHKLPFVGVCASCGLKNDNCHWVWKNLWTQHKTVT